DEVTRIKVNFREYNMAEDVALAIQKQFPNTLVEPYRKRIKNIDMLIKITDIKTKIFITIILIVAAGIIINTVLTSVFERKREIGTLRAIGAGRFEMVIMILGEVILVSLIAALIGSILAGVLVNWLSFKGLHFGQMANIADFMTDVVFPEIVWSKWVGNILFILFWTLLAALYPVILAVKVKPCDALRR
ncbi:MAG: FtsX-like permease family protein, partial [Candidatus Cloacimonadota bacterium]